MVRTNVFHRSRKPDLIDVTMTRVHYGKTGPVHHWQQQQAYPCTPALLIRAEKERLKLPPGAPDCLTTLAKGTAIVHG
jgi:hypothetical protein